MPFYKFDGENRPLGRVLRTGLDSLRDGVNKLKRIADDMQQMSDAQLVDQFGFDDTTLAASAKAEIASDDAAIIGISAQVNQLLAQFG
jgi:hypothetical protein